jgi:hypothetical protein
MSVGGGLGLIAMRDDDASSVRSGASSLLTVVVKICLLCSRKSNEPCPFPDGHRQREETGECWPWKEYFASDLPSVVACHAQCWRCLPNIVWSCECLKHLVQFS